MGSDLFNSGDRLIFAKGHRLDAFKFALRDKGVKSGLLSACKAFCTRDVKVSKAYVNMDTAEISSMEKKKVIERVVTADGYAKQRIKGSAGDLDRRIVVRIWPFKNIDSPGHSAISMVNKMKDDGGSHQYLSWVPEDGLTGVPIVNNFVKVRGSGIEGYKLDKYMMLSDSARAAIINGSDLRSHQKSLKGPMHIDGRNNDTMPFGVCADKCYFPLRGWNRTGSKQTGSNPTGSNPTGSNPTGSKQKPCFVLFGLDEEKSMSVFDKYNDSDNKNPGYRFASSHNNCAGVCLKVLRAGGMAEFIDDEINLVLTPNDLYEISCRLVDKVEMMNEESSRLIDVCEEFFSGDWDCGGEESFLKVMGRLKSGLRHLVKDNDEHKLKVLKEVFSGINAIKTSGSKDELYKEAARVVEISLRLTSFKNSLSGVTKVAEMTDLMEKALSLIHLNLYTKLKREEGVINQHEFLGGASDQEQPGESISEGRSEDPDEVSL